jgi:hypothetical protein
MESKIVMKLRMNSRKTSDVPKIVIQNQIAVKMEYAFKQEPKPNVTAMMDMVAKTVHKKT